MNFLVHFHNDSTGDSQYHYFTGCKERFDILDDSLFKKFVLEYDYFWEAIEFPEALAILCMFTQSEVEHHERLF